MCAFAQRWINAAWHNAAQINIAAFDKVIFRDYAPMKRTWCDPRMAPPFSTSVVLPWR